MQAMSVEMNSEGLNDAEHAEAWAIFCAANRYYQTLAEIRRLEDRLLRIVDDYREQIGWLRDAHTSQFDAYCAAEDAASDKALAAIRHRRR